MTKAEIIEQVYQKVGFSKKEATNMVELIFDLLRDTLEKGEKVKISGFGNFLVRSKRTRRGRNPKTGEEIEINSRKVLTFKPSKLLKEALNRQERRA